MWEWNYSSHLHSVTKTKYVSYLLQVSLSSLNMEMGWKWCEVWLSETSNPVITDPVCSFRFAATCRELLLSPLGSGVSEKLPGWHWWLLAPACQKMFIWGHWRLGKIRTSLFEVSAVTQLSFELARGSMLSTDECVHSEPSSSNTPVSANFICLLKWFSYYRYKQNNKCIAVNLKTTVNTPSLFSVYLLQYED